MPRQRNILVSRPTAPKKGARADLGEAADAGSLESGVVKLAVGGKLARAGRQAILAQRKRRLPITFKRGDEVIKLYADGREEILEKLQATPYVLPNGVKIIGRGK